VFSIELETLYLHARIPLISLKPVPPTSIDPMTIREWYGINLMLIFSTPHTSSQHSAALLGTDSAGKTGETPGVEGNRQSSSQPETTTSEKIKKAWGVTQSGLLTALRLLEKSADAFPPLKSAVGGLVACLDLAQVSYGCEFNTV
jgi:hypothetical protein